MTILRRFWSEGKFAWTEINVFVSVAGRSVFFGTVKAAIFKMVSPIVKGASALCWKICQHCLRVGWDKWFENSENSRSTKERPMKQSN